MEGRVRFMLTLVLPLLWKVARGQLDTCKPKTVDVGDNLELHCDCEVDPDVVINVQWFKFEEQRDQFLPYQSTITERDADERNLKFESVNVSVGGVYKCTCDSSSPQCFDVTVKVHIVNFDAEPDVVRVNESFTLTCIAVGFPPPTGFQLTKDDNLRIKLTELIHLKNGVYHRVVARNKDYDGNYTCLVYNTESTDVADKEVTVYEPPRIVGVKNFTFSDAALQHTAVLECAIENRTTTACVQWIRSNTIITPSEKYRTDVVKRGRDPLIFALTVRDLSESDIGEYLCRLSSEYNDTEGSATAFIHSPSPMQLPPGETPGGTVPDDKEEDNQSAAITGTGVAIAFIAIVIFGVVACVALIYCRNFRHHGTGNADHTSSTPGGVVSTPGDSTSTTPIPTSPSTFSFSSSHPSEVSLRVGSEAGADVTLGASTTELHNQQEPTERKKFDFDDLRLRKGSYKTPPASPHANILPRN